MKNPIASINLDDGRTILVELYPEIAPNTVNNFIQLANSGRYDGLIHEIDEKQDIPSVGFGMGIERILYFLEKEGVELPPMETPDLYVGILGAEAKARAFSLVNEIRSHGLIVETDYMDRSVKAQMKYANKIGAKKVVIIGANELEKGTASVKDMATGEQAETELSRLPELFA